MNAENLNENAAADKFLVYQLGEDLFATRLIEIRSVIEFQSAKPIPHTEPYYKGVINLRGEIIGAIDLRVRLGLSSVNPPNCQLIIDSTAHGALAAIVDKVVSVAILNEAKIDRQTSKSEALGERPYYQGVIQHEDKILTLISLREILSR